MRISLYICPFIAFWSILLILNCFQRSANTFRELISSKFFYSGFLPLPIRIRCESIFRTTFISGCIRCHRCHYSRWISTVWGSLAHSQKLTVLGYQSPERKTNSLYPFQNLIRFLFTSGLLLPPPKPAYKHVHVRTYAYSKRICLVFPYPLEGMHLMGDSVAPYRIPEIFYSRVLFLISLSVNIMCKYILLVLVLHCLPDR